MSSRASVSADPGPTTTGSGCGASWWLPTFAKLPPVVMDPGSALRGACHRAALCADPLAALVRDDAWRVGNSQLLRARLLLRQHQRQAERLEHARLQEHRHRRNLVA